MKKFSFIMIGCVLVSLWVFLFFAEDSAKVLLRVSVNDCRIKVIHVSDYSLAVYVDGEYTQTLHLDPLEGEEIKLLEVSTADISFDGFSDLLVPYGSNAAAQYYLAFLWQNETRTFFAASGFESIPNPSIDPSSSEILGIRSSDSITSYGIWQYKATDGSYFLTASLTIESLTENTGHLCEYQRSSDGAETIIFEAIIPMLDQYTPDQNHPSVSNFFSEGSRWSLRNNKWHNFV